MSGLAAATRARLFSGGSLDHADFNAVAQEVFNWYLATNKTL